MGSNKLILKGISYKYSENSRQVNVILEDPKFKKSWGTARTLLYNNVTGVSNGFSLTLNLVGVGYKAQLGESVNGQPLPIIEANYKEKYGSEFKKHLNSYLEGQNTNLTLKLGFSHFLISLAVEQQ